MSSIKKSLLSASLAVIAASAHAAPVVVTGASATGSTNNPLSLLTDGVFPADDTFWSDTSNVWWTGGEGPGGTVITLAFDQLYTLQDVTLTVDNNDFYQVQVSQDGTTWNTLFTLLSFDGTVGSGVDTFSSVSSSSDYATSIDFAATPAKFARIYAAFGDGNYSVGEVKFTGIPSVVPEPQGLALLGAGLATAGLLSRRRRRA